MQNRKKESCASASLGAMILGLLAVGISQPAGAATVTFADFGSLSPKDSFSVDLNAEFDVDIIGVDFDADELTGGTFFLGYDESLLIIKSVTVDSRWDFVAEGGVDAGADLWGAVGFDIFTGLPGTGDFRVATISFTARDAFGASSLKILDSNFFVSNASASAAEFTPASVPYAPTIVDAVISVVPIPGTLWLMLTGFAGIAWRAVRRPRHAG